MSSVDIDNSGVIITEGREWIRQVVVHPEFVLSLHEQSSVEKEEAVYLVLKRHVLLFHSFNGLLEGLDRPFSQPVHCLVMGR